MKFLGFKRKDGSVGVRNHVLILPSCACASETCRVVASQVLGTKNVIINVGCSDVTANTEMTQRVLTGFALNANVFGVVVIDLAVRRLVIKSWQIKFASCLISLLFLSESKKKAERSKQQLLPLKRLAKWLKRQASSKR